MYVLQCVYTIINVLACCLSAATLHFVHTFVQAYGDVTHSNQRVQQCCTEAWHARKHVRFIVRSLCSQRTGMLFYVQLR
jgi:hypothetical protein